jgi:alpha-mannosidase
LSHSLLKPVADATAGHKENMVMGRKWRRREIIRKGAQATLAAALCGDAACRRAPSGPRPTLYIVPNTHGTVAGWLDDFDTERNYCLNNYLDHLDRVDSDPNYAFAYSEVPNLISLFQFAPDRLQDLKERVREGRVELVNAFFLESTMNLSGGEAIVQLGVHGLRWYEKFFGLRPRHGWMIDVVGNHRQMPQIVAGLGLETLLFCRNNPARKTAFWWVAPDGTRMLTICNANSYAELPEIFTTKEPLSSSQLAKIATVIEWKREHSPSQTTLLALAGSGDYSLAPVYQRYPAQLLQQWREHYPDIDIRFSTLSDYANALRAEIKSGGPKLEEVHGDTAYCFNAFWYDLPQIKREFSEMEYQLEASEMVATAASLHRNYVYPSQDFYHCWIDLALNMDRNALWGSAGGKVFVDPKSWDVEDRYASVRDITSRTLSDALAMLTGHGESLVLFNPLNWQRDDPLKLHLPPGKRIAGFTCEASLGDPSRVLCRAGVPAAAIISLPLENGAAAPPQPTGWDQRFETDHYVAAVDRDTGALISLKLKATAHELLGGPANVVYAESVAGILRQDPGDYMLPRPQRRVLATSSHYPAQVRAFRGPLATTITARSEFYGGSALVRRIRFHHQFPRIDFETQLDLRGTEVLITVDFPLAADVIERTRGIPYGFATIDPRHPFRPLPEYQVGEAQQHGFSDAILPAVGWSDYRLLGDLGTALLTHGLAAHELNGRTLTLGLFNAHARYNGWPNRLMAGRGPHRFRYALVPHNGSWRAARIPQMACEFGGPVFARPGSQTGLRQSFLETSDNVILGALRRAGKQIELRFYEWRGQAAEGQITLRVPHASAFLTNFMGEDPRPLAGGPAYRLPIRPQQIVTMRFDADSAVAVPELVQAWQPLATPNKRMDLGRRLLLKGHPPFGPGS